MNMNANMPGIDPETPNTALSLYSDDAQEEFPVLKAFQQYIDSEQAKARKRLVSLCIFFGFLMALVISVFVMMLLKISDRNQVLNDRLVEYAMKDRESRAAAPVVVQPPQPAPDNSALLALTEKLADMQKQLADSQAQAAKAAEEAAAAVAKAKQGPTEEEKQIAALKAQLQTMKENAAAEKEKQRAAAREAELEAYRRKYYPELYAPQPQPQQPVRAVRQRPAPIVDEDEDLDDELDDDSAISYFDEEEPKAKVKAKVKAKSKPKVKAKEEPKAEEKVSRPAPAVQKSSGGWLIPED